MHFEKTVERAQDGHDLRELPFQLATRMES